MRWSCPDGIMLLWSRKRGLAKEEDERVGKEHAESHARPSEQVGRPSRASGRVGAHRRRVVGPVALRDGGVPRHPRPRRPPERQGGAGDPLGERTSHAPERGGGGPTAGRDRKGRRGGGRGCGEVRGRSIAHFLKSHTSSSGGAHSGGLCPSSLPLFTRVRGSHIVGNWTSTLQSSIAVYDDIDPCKPWLHERLPKPFGISVVRR